MKNNLTAMLTICLLIVACTYSSHEHRQKISRSYVFNSGRDTIDVSFLIDTTYKQAPLGTKRWNDSQMAWSFTTNKDTIDIFFYYNEAKKNITLNMSDLSKFQKNKAKEFIHDAVSDSSRWFYADDIEGIYMKSFYKNSTFIIFDGLSKNKLGGYVIWYYTRSESFDFNNFKKIVKTIKTEHKTAERE